MQFRLLGPLEVVVGGQAVDLPRRKHRALLAALLLSNGSPLSLARLEEALWGDTPPRTARNALKNYISQLRRTPVGDILVTSEAGYLLDVDPDQIDLVRFERLCTDARRGADVEERAAKLREALDLWRGPPLADLAQEPFATIEIPRLVDLRVAAFADAVDAELELGRHVGVVPQLEAVIDERPFDERLRGQLMLALYRCGRQAAALEAYRSARRVLDEELGLEPGRELRALEQAILRHDPALAAPDTARETQAASRRTVTVVVTSLVEDDDSDPESAVGRIGAFEDAIARHGGRARFVGDTAIGLFGAPTLHEDDPLRAIRAAGDLRTAMPDVRVGIATGEVLSSGDAMTGAPFSAARRLEQGARQAETVLSPTTLRLVRDAVRVTRLRRRGQTVFRLDQLVPGAPGLARRLDRTLVDREVELAALRRAFDTVRDERRCLVVGAFGEAGIGKTRLARELVAQARDEAAVLVGRCVSYGEGATYMPLREMIGADFEAIFEEAGSTGEIFLATRRWFEERARKQPLLLVFDDLHWAEPTLLDLIEYLGGQATDAPILALCLSRPDVLAERPGLFEDGRALVLEPLTKAHTRELVGSRPQTDRIVELAEGNPLYAEQLAAYADEGGTDALDRVPASIEALLASRLERLEPGERALAQRAAVVGRRFTPAAVAALGPVEPLSQLEESGFVHPAGEMYRFHHVLVRDVVYAGTPKAERAELHRLHAEWLDVQPERSAELVGYHLEQAARYLGELGAPEEDVTRLAREAARRLGAAGIRAWKRGDTTTTINLLGRATSLLPERDPQRIEWMCELAGALRTAGELARSEATFGIARDEAEAANARNLAARAELGSLAVRLLLDPRADADELLDRATAAVPLLEEYGDDRALGRAWMDIADVHGSYHLNYGRTHDAGRKALLHYRRAGWPESVCLGTIAAALHSGPTPVPEAISACRDLLTEADLNGRANVLAYLGGLEAMAGDFEQARAQIAQSRGAYRELGQSLAPEIICGSVESDVELLAGDVQQARELLESSCAVLERHGNRAYLATRQAALADVLYRQGDFDAAARLAQSARNGSGSDDLASQWRYHVVEAKLAAGAGDPQRAELLARAAVSLLADTDVLDNQATCALALAEVLTVAGRHPEADHCRRDALALLERKGNVVAAQHVRVQLAEKTESP